MRIYEAKDYQEMSRKAANILAAQVILKPDCVLGLATGSSPIGTYDQLVEGYEKGDLDFSEVKQSTWMSISDWITRMTRAIITSCTNIFLTVSTLTRQIQMCPNGMAEDIAAECERYEELIRSLEAWISSFLGSAATGISVLTSLRIPLIR